ncbi:MAG: YqaA family protein [Thermoanaerobaculia bacterium]
MEWVRDLFHWVEALADTPYATWSLAGVSFVESSFFPVPPDALLIALCVAQPERSMWFALVCSISSVLGGMAGYGIGLAGGRPILRKFFNPTRIERVREYYDRYNAWAVGIAGLTPLPYKLFTISGGAFQINFKVFVIASIVSRSLRFFAVAALIEWLGEPAKVFIEKHLGWLSIAFVILLMLGFWSVGRKARAAARG